MHTRALPAGLTHLLRRLHLRSVLRHGRCRGVPLRQHKRRGVRGRGALWRRTRAGGSRGEQPRANGAHCCRGRAGKGGRHGLLLLLLLLGLLLLLLGLLLLLLLLLLGLQMLLLLLLLLLLREELWGAWPVCRGLDIALEAGGVSGLLGRDEARPVLVLQAQIWSRVRVRAHAVM